MKIRINSTSFLIPGNENWKHLKKNNDLFFSDYGNFNNTNLHEKVDVEINLLFLPDLFDFIQQENLIYKKEIKKISNIIKLIKQKFRNNNKKIIVGISGYLYNNIINFSKFINVSFQLKNYFLDQLYKLAKTYNNLFVVDLDTIFSENGHKYCLDQRNYYIFKCRLSTFGIEILSKNLGDLVKRLNSTNKKVLLLDCDNTIWGGVLGEEGIENIQIGQDGIGTAFSDFQKSILKVKNSGILIVLVSKNNREDVENVLENHQSMILRKKDITAMKVNWNEKSKNIRQLSKDLSLGLNSFVFWDDNPIEREKVRAQLKEVDVIEPETDVTSWPKQLLEYKGFSKFIVTKEDILKTKQYKIREKFIEDKYSSKNEINYLKSIKIKPSLVKIDKSTLNRTVQMCQKTNQFNLRTKKYNTNDILKLKDKNICFLVKLKDIYGDHGIIAFISLNIIKNKFIFIDSFLMSCRILGRYVESWILNEIRKIAIKRKIDFILAEYIPTKRNIVARNFILKNNFKKIPKKKVSNFDIFIKKLINENNNSEFYKINTKTIIPNLEIYEKNSK